MTIGKTPLRRAAAIALVASLVLSGLLGIASLLFDEFGSFQAKVLLSSVTVSAASILALSCAAVLDRGRQPLAIVGVMTTAVTTVMTLFVIWFDPPTGDWFGRLLASVATVSVALAHASLLSLARLARRFEPVRLATYTAVAALTASLLVLYWSEYDEQWYIRLVGIISICVTVLTILVPIFHRMSVGELRATGVRPDKVNFAQLFAGIEDTWNPSVVASLNNSHVIRASRLLGTYVRHKHTDEDEFFLVVRGSLTIRFDDATVTLHEGEGLLVPAGVYHEPEATEEAHVLLFEPEATVKTGD